MSNLRANVDVVQECWRRVVHAFGTAAIFERRARRLQTLARVPAFLGVAVPGVIGTIALGWGPQALTTRPAFMWTAGVLGVIQIGISLWSLVARWDPAFAYALESATDNRRFAVQFEKLVRNSAADLAAQFDLLDAVYQARSDADVKQVIEPRETRFGLRCGLHHLQRPCVHCKKIPIPDKPTSCSVCGK